MSCWPDGVCAAGLTLRVEVDGDDTSDCVATPCASLAGAMGRRTPDRNVIKFGPGIFSVPEELFDSGATTLEGAGSAEGGGATTTLRGTGIGAVLRIYGYAPGSQSPSVRVSDLILEGYGVGATDTGVHADGGKVLLEDVVIRGFWRGIDTPRPGGSVEVMRSHLTGNRYGTFGGGGLLVSDSRFSNNEVGFRNSFFGGALVARCQFDGNGIGIAAGVQTGIYDTSIRSSRIAGVTLPGGLRNGPQTYRAPGLNLFRSEISGSNGPGILVQGFGDGGLVASFESYQSIIADNASGSIVVEPTVQLFGLMENSIVARNGNPDTRASTLRITGSVRNSTIADNILSEIEIDCGTTGPDNPNEFTHNIVSGNDVTTTCAPDHTLFADGAAYRDGPGNRQGDPAFLSTTSSPSSPDFYRIGRNSDAINDEPFVPEMQTFDIDGQLRCDSYDYGADQCVP